MGRFLGCSVAAALATAVGCGGGPDCNDNCFKVGATQCSGTQIATCTADASGCLTLAAPVSCAFGSSCSAAANACVPCVNTCSTAGASQCVSSTQQQTCTADVNGCLALAAPTDCPAGSTCFANQNRCIATAEVTCSQAPVVIAAPTPVGPASEPAACQLPIGTSTLPAQQVQHLGTVKVGNTVPFTIPPGTGGFSIVSQAVSAQTTDITLTFPDRSTLPLPNSVVPEIVTAPDGSELYDDFGPFPDDESTALAFYGGLSPSTGAFTVPNTTAGLNALAGGVPAGTWNVKVGDLANECTEPGLNDPTQVTCSGGSTASTYDVTVLTKPLVGATGILDVGIHLVTASGLTAAAAADPGNAATNRFVSTLATLYGRAGLCLGNVTFYDVPQWAKDKFATGVDADQTGPCSNLDQMFTLSVPDKNELSFFFVDDIVQPVAGGGDGSVVGIDGTIPGPSSIGGTVASGAVVNFADLGTKNCGSSLGFSGPATCGSDEVAYIAAHEGGHWMGLYHTSEGTGDLFDPVADTGQCVCSACVPSAARAQCTQNNPDTQAPTFVHGTDCDKGGSCDGSQYLMFWLIDGASVGAFSPQQAQIVRANPVVR